MQDSYILAGDIGGTKTILALAEAEKGDIEFLHLKWYESRNHDSLEKIIEQFLREVIIDRSCTVASFGIAGAVKDGRCRTTNLPWAVDAEKVAFALGLKKVSLVNDFTAATLGIPCLNESDLYVLNEGKRVDKGPIAVIGAGTGLGEGAAFYSEADEAYAVISSEGGHCSFSPTSDEEMELLRFLMNKLGHVSFERLLSGQGLVNIYEFLVHRFSGESNASIAEEMKINDPAAVITRHAMDGSDKLAGKALDLFIAIYGSEAGNVALKFLPYGGLYIGGGIAPKIASRLGGSDFIKAFLDKGRMKDLLSHIPVSVVLKEEVGLLGALVKGRELIKKI